MNLAYYSAKDFDRGAPPWKEALWWIMRDILFLNSWPWPSTWRVRCLRVFGAKIGSDVVIRAKVNISFPWRLCIGNHVWLGEEVMVLSLADVTIESNVCISQRAFLCTGSHDYRVATFDLVTKPITVRTGSWIGAEAFIAPGLEVGEGSVVSAGSVVFENVPPRTVVRGNPAVVLKSIS